MSYLKPFAVAGLIVLTAAGCASDPARVTGFPVPSPTITRMDAAQFATAAAASRFTSELAPDDVLSAGTAYINDVKVNIVCFASGNAKSAWEKAHNITVIGNYTTCGFYQPTSN